jgi:hypothetical protein
MAARWPRGSAYACASAWRTERGRIEAWYEVLACYKLAIILEGTYARACAGKAERAVGDALHATALALIARASARIAAS